MKKIALILLALVLLALPLVARWLYFYEVPGRYKPPAVARPDLAQIQAPALQAQPYTDQFVAGSPGTVLLDMAHENHVQMADVGVLQARLAARQQRLEPVSDAAAMEPKLRYARALVIISPGQDWTAGEIEMARQFVDRGGRLLLVADPARFGVLLDEWGSYVGLDQDVNHLNDLAARFGLVFRPDYLYNTVESEGNYRNIRLGDFASSDLATGLDQVVFFGAHSIVSDGPALIWTGGETRSSASERSEELTVAALAADGAVLALGDLSFMAEPYNTVSDNDRLVANVASFLAGAPRRYELQDFPFFFDAEVDLVYADDPLLGGDLLVSGSGLQSFFEEQGLALTVRASDDESHDTLFFGLYRQAEEVEPYLDRAGVSLHITATLPAGADSKDQPEPTPAPTPAAVPAAALAVTQPLTTTASLTPTIKVPSPAQERIEIQDVGEMVITGTSLLLLQTDGDRQVMVVLANTEQNLAKTLERLTKGDLKDCLFQARGQGNSDLALCPAAAGTSAGSAGGWSETSSTPAPALPTAVSSLPTPSPEPQSQGSILIVSLDDGQGRYDSLTGADDFLSILQDQYEVSLWSKAEKGTPGLPDLQDRDLVVLTSGDFQDAFGEDESALFLSLVMEGVPVLISGAYIGDAQTQAVQRDLLVQDASHPLAKGFKAGEVILFDDAPSGSEYEIDVLTDLADSDSTVVFCRGPASEASGEASIAAMEDEFSGERIVWIGLPIYLLPQTARSQLVLNAISWLLSP